MKSASEILIALKNGNGLLYQFATNAEGTPTTFKKYDIAKIKQIWDYIEGQNFFDMVGFRSGGNQADFTRLVNGQPLQTETQRIAALHNGIATMSADTLAQFTAFIFNQGKYNRQYLADRIADGSFGIVVARIDEIGERMGHVLNYAGSAFAKKQDNSVPARRARGEVIGAGAPSSWS